MIKIRPLPHGSVPANVLSDTQTRKIILMLNENVLSLSSQMVELQNAVLKMQRK